MKDRCEIVLEGYSVFDVKSDSYMIPWFVKNRGIAMRMFGDLVNDPQSQVSKHPEDYRLHRVADWDENTGEMIGVTPEYICQGADFMRSV